MKKNLFVFFILVFFLAGCATQENLSATHQDEMGQKQQSSLQQDIDYSTSKVSDKGVYTISYKIIGGFIKINWPHSWEVTVLDAQGKPVNDARLVLSGKMMGNDYGLPVNPVITRAGFEGLYRIDNMKFDKPGVWVISIDVMAGEKPDSVSFNIDIH